MTASLVTKLAVEYNSTTPFTYAFADLSGVGTGPYAAAHAALDTTGALINPARKEDVLAVTTALGAPAQDATMQSILAAIQAARTETVWTDDGGAFYIRVDKGSSLSWLTPAGAASSGPGAGARPAAGASVVVDRSPYQATAAGTGFALNDFLDHFVTADPASGAVISSFWLNATQGTVLASAPSAASITPAAALPTGAATSAGQASLLAALAGVLQIAVKSNAPRVATTGTLAAANAQVALAVDGMSTGILQLSGTWAGTIGFYGSVDGGASVFVMNMTPMSATGGSSTSIATGNGQWEFSTAGLTHVYLAMQAYTSGSATALLAASNGGKMARVKAPATDPLPVMWTGQSVTLAPGSATFGAISNTSFGISGTLPAFASTPTFNLGTLNGAALDTSVQAVKTALGSPFQVGGTIGNTSFGATQSGAWTVAVQGSASAVGASLGPAAALGVVQQDAQLQTLSVSSAAALTNATYATGAIPTAGFQSATIEFTSAGTGNTITVEGSNSGTNWQQIPIFFTNNPGNGAPVLVSPPSAGFVYQVPLTTAFVRVRVTVYGSGTVTAVMALKVTPAPQIANFTTPSNAASVATAANQQRAIAFTDTTTALAASGAVTNSAHATSIAQGSAGIYAYFNVNAFADQAGTLFIEGSIDNFTTTTFPLNGSAGTAVAAGTSVVSKVPITMPYMRTRYTNGTTAQSKFAITTSFSAA